MRSLLLHCYLQWVKAGDDSAVLHMAAPGGVGKLALCIRAWAGTSLKLTTHFQGQPFGVPSHGHADSHQRRSPNTEQRWGGGGGQTDGKLCDECKGWLIVKQEKESPEKHRGGKKPEAKIFSVFPSARIGGESFWLMYFGGSLLVLPGNCGSWGFTRVR